MWRPVAQEIFRSSAGMRDLPRPIHHGPSSSHYVIMQHGLTITMMSGGLNLLPLYSTSLSVNDPGVHCDFRTLHGSAFVGLQHAARNETYQHSSDLSPCVLSWCLHIQDAEISFRYVLNQQAGRVSARFVQSAHKPWGENAKVLIFCHGFDAVFTECTWHSSVSE